MIRNIWHWIGLYLSLLFFLLGLLVLVNFIPSEWLKLSLKNSVRTLESEGFYPSVGTKFRPIVLDNFTDSLMLNTAYSIDNKSPFGSALRSVYNIPTETTNIHDQILSLKGLVEGNRVTEITYDRYWHGYLVYLRPLLVIFNYSQIRLVLITTILLLAGRLLYLTWKKIGKVETICLGLGLLSVDILSIGNSMQFSGVFLISLVSAIHLLTHKGADKKKVFFVVGGLTAFVDLLTAPLITLEMLLIIVGLMVGFKGIKNLMKDILAWVGGYFSIWMSKWILSQLFYTAGSFYTALEQVRNRTVGIPDENFSWLATLKLNLFQMIGYSRMSKIFVLCLGVVIMWIILKNWKYFVWKNNYMWLIVATIPYLWYLVVANHSYLHVWYTHRIQFGSVVAGLLMVAGLLKHAPERNNKIT